MQIKIVAVHFNRRCSRIKWKMFVVFCRALESGFHARGKLTVFLLALNRTFFWHPKRGTLIENTTKLFSMPCYREFISMSLS